MASREQFEEWAARSIPSLDLSKGNHGAYQNVGTHWLYCAWVASRDHLSVGLPKEIRSMAGALMYAEDVREAVETAGLKYEVAS